jgi:hypothetical protein
MSDDVRQAADPLAIATAVAAAVSSQPDLFGAGSLSAEEHNLVRIARRGTYSGQITLKNEARVAQVVALRQQGCSMREIHRRTGMDHRVIRVVLQHAEKRREITALKDEVTRRLAEVTESAIERLQEEIDKPKADPAMIRSLGVVAGIGSDKVSAAPQVTGDLHLHQHIHGPADPMREYLVQRSAVLATESEAAASAPKSNGHNGASSRAAAVAADSCAGPTIDVQAPEAPEAAQGGGGVAQAPGGSEPRGNQFDTV